MPSDEPGIVIWDARNPEFDSDGDTADLRAAWHRLALRAQDLRRDITGVMRRLEGLERLTADHGDPYEGEDLDTNSRLNALNFLDECVGYLAEWPGDPMQ